MPSEAFSVSVLAWHDFYGAVAAATAGLLGLLFVAVSIRFSSLDRAQRTVERGLAATVFGNLVSALVLAFVVLIPGQGAKSIAIQIGLVTVLSIIRVIRRSRELLGLRPGSRARFAAIRRTGWTVFAIVMLGYAAIGLWVDGAAGYLYSLLAAVFIFLVGAADVSWNLLLDEELR